MDFGKVIEDWANVHPRASLKTHYNDGYYAKVIIVEMSLGEFRIARSYLPMDRIEEYDEYYLMDLLDAMYDSLLKEYEVERGI